MPPLLVFPAPNPLRTDRADAASALSVTGADRTSFLTRIMSGDLPPAPGAARTALLGPKGNLIAAAVATVTREAVFLECERVRGEALATALDRYRISDDVEIHRLDLASGALLRVEGGAATDPQEPTAPGKVLENGAGFLRRDFRPWRSLTVFEPGGTPLQGASGTSPEEQEYLRILAGEPRWGAELDGASLPLASGLAAHVRLGKGCYIGQEYVARQAHRGRVPRLLRGLELRDSLPEPGAEISFEGRRAGRITSVAPRPPGWPAAARPLALAVVRAELEPGAVVEIGGEPAARVSALPGG